MLSQNNNTRTCTLFTVRWIEKIEKRSEPRPDSTYARQYIHRKEIIYIPITTNEVTKSRRDRNENISRNQDPKKIIFT